MTIFDYNVIGVYLIFMFSHGPIYKSFSKTARDFFRNSGMSLVGRCSKTHRTKRTHISTQ